MTLLKASGCKINLLLNILGKRPDGFHEIETVMQPVPLYDEIEFTPIGAGVQMSCDFPGLPCDGSNLVVRSASAFFAESGISAGVKMHLRKRIPMEAGLGGGSGNAATTLLGLNELFGNPLDAVRMNRLAAKLGSDVAFFLQDGPALSTGRGEFIEPLAEFRQLRRLALVLLHPGFGVSTPWAYKSLAGFPADLNGRPGRAREMIRVLESDDQSAAWGALLYNSLEAPAFWKYPILQKYVEAFKELGSMGSVMSGSGSTVFAWFEQRLAAENAIEKMRSRFGAAFWSVILA